MTDLPEGVSRRLHRQRRLARLIRGATLRSYADAAHGFYLQHARDFTPRLVRFLRP